MRITKKYVAISALSLAAIGASIAFAGNKMMGLNADGENEHGSDCVWRHYDAVSPTYEKHGSKEFWACCSHPGNYSFVAPTEGSVTDEGAFAGAYFDALEESDQRYVPSLYEGATKIYDMKEQTLVPQNYTPASYTSSKGHLDPVIGDYSTLDIKQADKEWLWFKPADEAKDISSYQKVFFYIRSNQTINNFRVFTDGYKAVLDDVKLEANVWTKISVTIDENCKTLRDIAPARYGAMTDVIWDISSYYAIEKAQDPFEGMTNLYDTQYNYYVPESYVPASLVGKDPVAKAGNIDDKYGYYCRIDVVEQQNEAHKCDTLWFRPAPVTSLDGYSKVVFYIRSNQTISDFKVRMMNWVDATSEMVLLPNAWMKVEVDLSGKSLTLKDIGLVSVNVYSNLIWDVTSIYGVK